MGEVPRESPAGKFILGKSRDFLEGQRRRDDNKNKIFGFEGGEALGAERKIVQNAVFRGKRHDNKILKVQILLSKNFVVMAQAPRRSGEA